MFVDNRQFAGPAAVLGLVDDVGGGEQVIRSDQAGAGLQLIAVGKAQADGQDGGLGGG